MCRRKIFKSLNIIPPKAGWLLLVCLFGSLFTVQAQNLNNPNKSGPLGVQVNTLSGNVFISRTDIYVPARGFDLDITFYYNSFLFTEEHSYGKGWSFEYNIKYRHDTTPGTRLIFWGDGREDRYDSLAGGSYKSPKGFFSKLEQYQPGKFVLTDLDSVQYFFDNAVHKRITRMQEPNGNYINFTYTDSLLTAMTNNAGQSISFAYNAEGRLATITDAITSPTRVYTYTYDTGGNLKEVKDPLNGKFKYGYLVNGPMKSLTDKNNNKVDIIYFPDLTARELIGCNKRLSFSYDTSVQRTVVTDHLASGNQVTTYTYQTVDGLSWITSMKGNCCGFNMSYEYDDQGNQVKMTDANGQVYSFTYDANGNMLTMTDPLAQTSFYTYTGNFNKISSYKDPKGNIYTLGYDSKGNLTQLATPGNNIYTATYNASGDIVSSADPKGNVYSYNYDAYGNPVSVTGPNGYNAALGFDARGNLLSFTDARGNQSTAEYDILDRLKKIIDPYNNQVQMNYDAAGNMTSLINKNNETSSFSYDASSRMVKVTGPTNKQVSFTYDGMDNLTSVKNPLGHESKFSYDTRNRLKGEKDAESNTASFSYDGNGNITGAILPNGQALTYTYDALNRLIAVRDATSTIAALTYDKNDNITSYTNATGAIITAGYDSLNRIKQITDPLGYSILYSYDKNNNITAITDREGRSSSYTYDSLDRVKTYTDNNGNTITVSYDTRDNITQLKDQNNNITTYTYDSLNRRKRMTYPDNKYQEFSYDKENNITSNRLTDGTVITYQYDTLNRLKTKTLPGSEVYSYNYDDMGRVTAATNNAGTVTFTYDALNRLITESFDGHTTRYAYSISGRTQTTIYPDSTTVIKEFDTRNRLSRILKDSITIAAYSYNNADQLVNKTTGNGVSTILQYDMANRLSNITSSNNIQNSSFSYDKERNKTAITRNNNLSLSEQFTYDNGYRLTNYKRGPAGSPVIQNSYTYDAVGNRTAANLNGATTTYSVNNLNQLTGVNSTSFSFDDRGNITFDGIWHKTYDAENRLKKDSASPANVITYNYDALGRRVVKTINGNTLKYTFSGAAPIEERNSSNTLLNRTVFTSFLSPVMNEKNGDRFYYHNNEMLSVEAISNSSGRLVESYRYDAYGKQNRYDSLNNPLASSIAGNRFGFTGQEFDSATNSYRFFFRNYSPETGVFNQRDLIEYEDGMGMYQYVGNNPANGIDIWGLEDCYNYRRENIAYKVSFSNEVIKWLLEKGADKELHLKTTIDIKDIKYHKDQYKKIMERSVHNRFKSGDKLKAARQSAEAKGRMNEARRLEAKVAQTTEKVGGANAKGLNAFGNGMNLLDNLVKGEALASSLVDGQSNEQYTQEFQAGGDFALSLLGWTPIGAGYGTLDFIVESATGKGITEHTADAGQYLGSKSDDSYERSVEAYEYAKSIGKGKQWLEARTKQNDRERNSKRNKRVKVRCPEGGTRDKRRWVWDLNRHMYVLVPVDPNLIVGPDGQPDKAWVSVNDRLPYTIMYENDTSATAPAKFVRITTPIEPRQEANTFELGNFGFNNQSFEIPAGNASYYLRLDCRDSLNLYVDIVAGYDPVRHEAFWEFQSIDPITLLPPEDPLSGFLLLQDTTQPNYGNGFVNFSIKPKANSQTLDTIGARAFIVFDQNDTIPTNIHKNTIDAVAPISQMNNITGSGTNPITLSWTGADDANGSGIGYYTIYVSTDMVNYSVLFPRMTRTDTTFSLPTGFNYCFFVLATDRTGNAETLRPGVARCYTIGSPLPVTWLYFNGTNIGKNNLLKWATASEQNSKEFRLERSLNGSSFSEIAVVPAAGNSTTERRYDYTDRDIDQLGSNTMFYRLKQVDLDTRFRYSSIVRLTYNAKDGTPSIVYPNPTNGMINLLVGDKSVIGKEAVISDMNGRVLRKVIITAANQTIDLSAYSSGVYLIRLSNDETLRLVKQ